MISALFSGSEVCTCSVPGSPNCPSHAVGQQCSCHCQPNKGKYLGKDHMINMSGKVRNEQVLNQLRTCSS